MAPPPSFDLRGKKVLVTGGAGFVGHNFIRVLVKQFNCKVTVIDNLWRGSLDNLKGLIDVSQDFIKGDLTEPSVCEHYIRDYDIVYHLADIVAGVDFVFSNQPFVFRQNLLINTNVLGACVKNGIKNYIYVGTACSFPQHLQMVMDDSIVALREDQTYPAEPESSYGWSKLMGEYEANLAQQSGALNVGLLRLHNIYGPGSPYDPQRSQALPSLIRKALNHPAEEFVVWGSGQQYRDFLYIDDVCDALVLMAQKGMNQGVVQIGTGEACRLAKAAQIVAGLAKKIAGKDLAPFFDRSKPEGDRGRISINTRAKEVLGWTPKVTIEDGLERTFKWIHDDMQQVAAATPAVAELPFIPQMAPWFGDEEANHMGVYMKSDAHLTEFKKTREFEKMLCDYTGAKHCLVVPNGTITLSLALLAVGVGPGDDVLVPDWTMVATPNSAKMIGANPVFVDIDPVTWCIDIDKIAAAITPKTKAVVHVQMNARSNDIEALVELCKARGIPLVEDSAQALGSFYKGKHLGRFGAVSSFSFSAPKIISTGQGGALLTDSDELHDKLKKMKDFGRMGGGNDTHGVIGWNFKFTDMQAVVGIEQMKKLPWRVARMRTIYQTYKAHLKGVKQVMMNDHDDREEGWLPWFIDIFVDDRDELNKYLKSKGIGTRPVYPPLHTQTAYKERNNMSYPVTEYVSRRGLWLPSSSKLTDEEIERICDTIKTYYQGSKL